MQTEKCINFSLLCLRPRRAFCRRRSKHANRRRKSVERRRSKQRGEYCDSIRLLANINCGANKAKIAQRQQATSACRRKVKQAPLFCRNKSLHFAMRSSASIKTQVRCKSNNNTEINVKKKQSKQKVGAANKANSFNRIVVRRAICVCFARAKLVLYLCLFLQLLFWANELFALYSNLAALVAVSKLAIWATDNCTI